MDESGKDSNVDAEMARMRAQAPTWNLAADHSLLQLMEKMHENIISKAKDTNAEMDNLLSQLNDADVYLNNVNNRFMALSNTQFVENRVYDDDIEVVPAEQKKDSNNEIISKDHDVNTSKEPNDIDSKELDLQATASALATLESYHEHIRIMADSDTDSDDESGAEISMASSLVLRPKDLYGRRPLPYIIGSEQWKARWHVGLVEEDSSSESDDDRQRSAPQPEQFSSSEDVTDDETIRTASEIGEIKAKITLPLRGKLGKDMESSESENDDLTSDISECVENIRGHAKQEGNTTEAFIKPQSTATASNFAAELAKRLGAPLPPKSDSGVSVAPSSIPEESKLPAKSYVHKQKEQVVGNIFSDEPPPLDQINDYDDPITEGWDADSQDENDIFADLRGTSKQFNTNTKLINSGNTANKYDDLFADILQPEDKKIDRKVEPIKSDVKKSKVRNLFDSDSDTEDIFAAIPTRSDVLPKSVVPKIVPELKGGLFDEDSDSGDLFSTETSLKKTVLKSEAVMDDKIQTVTPKSVNMFSDSDNDSPVPTKEHDVYESKNTVNKKPKGGVSLFQGNDTNIAAAILKHKPRISLSSDSSDSETKDESDRFVGDKPKNICQKLQGIPHQNIAKDIPEVEADAIFRDTKINEIYKPETDKNNLFSNTSKNLGNNHLFSKHSKDNEKYDTEDKNIFSQGDNSFLEDVREDDLFSGNKKDRSSTEIKRLKDQNIFSNASKHDIENDNLFSKDTNDNNLFSEDTKGNNIFSKDIGNDKVFREEIEDRFSKDTKEVKDESIFSKESQHSVKDKNIFSKDIGDDNLSSEDDLFSKQSKDNEIDSFSKNSKESKPEIKTKPQLLKPKNADRGETNMNKMKDDEQTISEENKIVEEKITPVIPKITQSDFKSKTSKLEMNKDLSPNLFSDESSISKDDFDNIFHSEPPEFEPEQRRTNNALFYDDDDDDIFSNNAGFKAVPPKEILFGDGIPEASKRKVAIFDDEPPNFEDDFHSPINTEYNIKSTQNSLEINSKEEMITKKSSASTTHLKNRTEQQSVTEPKIGESTDDLFNSSAQKADVVNNLDNIFMDSKNMFKIESNATKTGSSIFGESSIKKHAEKKKIFQDDDDDKLFQPSPRTDDSPTVNIKTENFTINSDDKLVSGENKSIDSISQFDTSKNYVSSKSNDTIKITESIAEKHKSKESPTRIIGKLKPSTLKINVNSLKPGAIPKFSTKSVESSTNPTENKEEIDSRIVKSVSFDESTNPSVLANISKDRPRIQVKRKPSTRKGRQDALRKSTIGLNYDKESSLSNDAVEGYVYSLPTSPQEVKPIEDSLKSVRYGSDHKLHDKTVDKPEKSKENITIEKMDIINSVQPITNDKPIIINEKLDISIDKPNISGIKPNKTSNKPNITNNKPHMSTEKRNITSDKLEISIDKPIITTNIPHITSDKSNITSDKPVMSSDKPNISTDKIDIGIVKPNVIGDKPNISIDNANITSDKTNISNDKPHKNIDRRKITSDKPNISNDKVDTGIDKPFISTNKLNTSTNKANITSDKPNITSEKSNITSDKPNITSDKPNNSTDSVNITSEKSKDFQNITSKNLISNDEPDIANEKARTISVEISASNIGEEISKSVLNDEIKDFFNVNTLGQTYKDEIENRPYHTHLFEKPSEIDNIFTNETSHIADTSSNNLFNDLFKSNSEEIVNEKIEQSVANIPKTIESTDESVSKTSISKANLFDDTENSEDGLFASEKRNISTKKTALLFADDFDDEDLFGSKNTQKSTSKNFPNSQNKPESQKTDLINEEKKEQTEIGMKDEEKNTLFSDSDSEDWFAAKFEKVKIKAKPEKSNEKSAEYDLFSSVKKSVFSKEPSKNLFADGDDESDIFGDMKKQASSSKSTAETNVRTQQQTTSKTQSIPSSAEQVFQDPLSSFDND